MIGAYAFQGCTSLSQITLVKGLTIIGYAIFSMVDRKINYVPSFLRTLTIPSTITFVGWIQYVYFYKIHMLDYF